MNDEPKPVVTDGHLGALRGCFVLFLVSVLSIGIAGGLAYAAQWLLGF